MLPIRFLPHSAQLAGGVAAWVNQIEQVSLDAGVALFEESAGSEVDREFVAAREVGPAMSFSTTDLALLTTVGYSGVPLIGAATNFTAYGRELPFGAVPTAIATTNHLKMYCTDGLLVPVSARASHNQAAKLALMLHAVLGTGGSSGATPFVLTASSAIPTGAGQVANIYTTGPTKFTISGGASRFVQGIADNAVDFGIQVFREGDSGNVYPSHVSIISRMSKIEFTTKDVELITEIGDGVAVSACTTYFQKVTANGQRVAPGTATHVSVGGTAGMITPGGHTLSHKQAGSAAFTFTPAKNTNQLTISIAAAIPTS